MTQEEYFQTAKEIWQNNVPKSGQSHTVEGELIRSIEKLRDEAQRNGNINRDSDHQIMIDYIRSVLTQHASFDDAVKDEINKILDDIKDENKIVTDDYPYDYLTDRSVDVYRDVGSVSREVNPLLKR